MDFRILGPLEVWDAGEPLELGAGKQRTLLAVLLLDAGSTVSVDRLIEALWEDATPASAVNSVHVYVSQLRKVLGARVVTRGRGYAIEVEPGELDVQRFEQRITEGREQLARGDAEGAATVLAEGLGLWRGPPLAEFSYDAFAQGEIRRLEELRLTTREELIDAELERGRHAQLVPELEALVAEHPLRERLRAQLMLALYRSGRQAEALAAYRAGREATLDELGLEPGPALKERETAILRQDAGLELTRKVLPAQRSQPPRRARFLIVAGGAVLLVAIGAAGLALSGGENGAELTAVAANSVAVIDPETDRVVADIPVGVTPSSITAAAGGVWALNADDRTLSKISPASLRVSKTVAAEREPMDVAAGAGAVWVGSGAEAANSEFVGTLVPVAVARLDPDSGVVAARLPLPRSRSGPGALARRGPGEHQIAVGDDDVWAIDGKGSLSRFDPGANRVASTARGLSARSLATDRSGLWVGTGDNAVLRVPSGSTRVAQRIELETFSLGGIAAGASAVWVTDPTAGTLWRIDPAPSVVTRTIPVGAGAFAVAFGEGSVWVVNTLDSTVLRIDPASNRVVARIPIGGTPREIAVGHGRVWVSVAVGGDPDRDEPISGAPRREVQTALPASLCGQVSYGGDDTPQFLVASNLPLRSGPRGSTLPMAQAVEFVLARHGFRAGPHTLGYQSCDDSTSQASGEDPAKCIGNAQALASARKVIGVIGPYGSGCASETIPILNRAPGGPLALVSPSNSYPGLTRPVSGAQPGALDGLYPTGARNYARVYPTDDKQSAALAMLAQDLGAGPVFVLEDEAGGGYTSILTSHFLRAADSLDLPIAGRASWNPDASTYRRLVERIARARPGAVFLSGIAFDNGGALVRQLREALPKDVAILAPDAFGVVSFLLREAGSAAEGMYVSFGGAPNSALGEAGKRFIDEFAATQPGGVVPSYSAAYAGQAAQILLAAIARSDGTRPSVTRELLRTRVSGGILGTFRIDRNGDASAGSITILRVTGRRTPSPTLLADHVGTVIDRVLTPPARLIAGGSE